MENSKYFELRNNIIVLFLNEKIICNNKTFLIKCSKWQKKFKEICKNKKNKKIIKDYFSLFKNSNEAWYCLLNRDSPSNHKCVICGKDAMFASYNKYLDICSKECRDLKRKNTCLEKYGTESAVQNKDIQNKIKNTCLEKYGTNHPLQNKDIQNKIKNTCLKKYGVEFPTQSQEIKDKVKQTCLKKYGFENPNQVKEFKEKRENTCLEKYGTPTPFQSIEIQTKIKNTCLEKYGVDNYNKTTLSKERHKNTCLEKYGVTHFSKTREFKERFQNTCLEKYGVKNPMESNEIKNKSLNSHKEKILEIEKKNNYTLLKHAISKYGQSWNKLDIPKIIIGNNVFIDNKYIPILEQAFESASLNRSSGEIELANFCTQELGVDIQTNVKNILPSHKELDIYIPGKQVAIEFNGVYWHSQVDKNYHLHKTEECGKLGIRLLHIWEDLWISKKEIYKSLISSSLNMYKEKIYARKCVCKEISSQDYKNFLEKNHIQGAVNSSIRLGLYYNNELVQVAGWGKSRFKKGEIELHRMCTKLYTQVVGGFSKLIKHSNLKEFISYIDRSLFDGMGYIKTNFSILGETPPSYFYFRNGIGRVNRLSAQKNKLPQILPVFNPNLSEYQNMINNGYMRIYDCGNLKVNYSSVKG